MNKQAVKFSVFLTLALFVTGLASVPWASHYDPMVQNFLYAIGRLPIIYVIFLAFTGVEDETTGD